MMERLSATLATAEGEPLACELRMRQSESAPARIKVIFTAPAEDGIAALHEGAVHPLQLPEGAEHIALGGEFRLEMN